VKLQVILSSSLYYTAVWIRSVVCIPKIDKIEYRAVIKFFVKEGLTPNEIHSKFINVYGDSSPSISTIKKWAAEFKHGRTSLENDPREGRPKSATTPEVIKQVHDMVLDDRRIKVREIGETIGISKKCAGRMKNWIWKSFAQDGCRACSQQIKNALAWKSVNSAWSVLTEIKLILYIARSAAQWGMLFTKVVDTA
jgi:transposase